MATGFRQPQVPDGSCAPCLHARRAVPAVSWCRGGGRPVLLRGAGAVVRGQLCCREWRTKDGGREAVV